MQDSLKDLDGALVGLSASILASKPDDNTFQATYGWNCPPLTSRQVCGIVNRLAESVRSPSIGKIDANQEIIIRQCVVSISQFQTNSLPQFFSGNCATAYPTFIALIDYIDRIIIDMNGWRIVSDKKEIPIRLARRIENLTDTLEKHVVDEKALADKIALINEAVETAEELPLTLKQLRESQAQISQSATYASEYIGKIDALHGRALHEVDNIKENAVESENLASQCSEAYRATTSVGLAAAFEIRAQSLGKSVYIWVIGLILALIAGAITGYFRFSKLTDLINSGKQEAIYVFIELMLSVFSLALPLWFAWLSTKQIGQRFRLSEDYAFKASVAKAYEGYRREATRFNRDIEERLFKAALTRLEEEPLRYVESVSHGSPLHDSVIVQTGRNAIESVRATIKDRNSTPKKADEKDEAGGTPA